MPISLYFTFRITHYFILFDHTRSFLNPVPHTLKPEPPSLHCFSGLSFGNSATRTRVLRSPH